MTLQGLKPENAIAVFTAPERGEGKKKRTRYFSPTDCHTYTAVSRLGHHLRTPATTDATSEWNLKPLEFSTKSTSFSPRSPYAVGRGQRPQDINPRLPWRSIQLGSCSQTTPHYGSSLRPLGPDHNSPSPSPNRFYCCIVFDHLFWLFAQVIWIWIGTKHHNSLYFQC